MEVALSLKQVPLLFPFGLALSATCFLSSVLAGATLLPFAPFLTLTYYRLSLSKALWAAFGCGLIVDLLSSYHRFGITSLTFCLTSFILYRQKRHFFQDKPIAFSLFSAIVSSFLTLTKLGILSLTEAPIRLNFTSAISDLVVMPLGDGVFAFLWFTCPIWVYHYFQKHGMRGLFKKGDEHDAS